jgi:streptomycin 6-kinase
MLPASRPFRQFATVEDWGMGFQRYLASGDRQLPKSLVEQGQNLYVNLCASQQARRLLHGDLHHYNILYDSQRGWTAIDPKGVVGEIEYEIGASLRNPYEEPELFTPPAKIEARLNLFEERLKIDFKRALAWGFAQAVLSAIWAIEDGFAVDHRNPSIRLANAMQPMLA